MDYQSHSMGSDKLRKAIDRNRAKQVKRGQRTTATLPRSPASRSTSGSVTRRTVAKHDTVEFGPINRTKSSKALTNFTYRKAPVRATKRAHVNITLSEKWQGILSKLMWGFCGILLLQLIFSNGGVIDYYSRVESLEQKQTDYNKIIFQNKEIISEIKKIKTNKSYQKKLVRDNLGLIAADEYLVVFP